MTYAHRRAALSLLAAVLLFLCAWWPRDGTATDAANVLTYSGNAVAADLFGKPVDIVIGTKHGEIIIHRDTGTVTLPDGLSADKAARVFWAAVGKMGLQLRRTCPKSAPAFTAADLGDYCSRSLLAEDGERYRVCNFDLSNRPCCREGAGNVCLEVAPATMVDSEGNAQITWGTP